VSIIKRQSSRGLHIAAGCTASYKTGCKKVYTLHPIVQPVVQLAGRNVLNIHTHTHPFNGPFSGTTRVSRYQKGKTNLDFTEARDSEWQWHQLGHRQVCTSIQTGNHASTPPLKFFTGRMPFLLPNQQRQSTEGTFEYFSFEYSYNK